MAVSSEQAAESRVRVRVEEELALELGRRGGGRLRIEDQGWAYDLVGRLVGQEQREGGYALDRAQCEAIWRRVFGAVTPLGPLAEYLADPQVEEIRINGTGACFVVRDGLRTEVSPPFTEEEPLVALVQWYADGSGSARLDRASPTVTMTLPDGSRLHAALTPPSRPMSVTIRRHPPARFRTLGDLAAAGFLPEAMERFLEAAVRRRLNILVAGGTGTGKTTFTRVLCRLIPGHERVVTIEDQAELHLWRDLADCVSLEGRPHNTEGKGAITIQMLVHEALRMSPDRIVIGEVRGGEALDLLDAMNTGHPGSICTLHSESPRDTVPRLVRLALRSPHAPGLDALVAEVARTVDLVIQLGGLGTRADGARVRRLRSLGYLAGVEAGRVTVDELVRLAPDGRWRRVGAVSAMPERILAKLEGLDPDALLEPLDA
ncbi:MAG: CpaF family protein [Candidatus Dormibacterales bacterium]